MASYDDTVFLGFLMKGALRPALDYLAQFPEKSAELQRYQRRFEQEQYVANDIDADLTQLLLVFQQYYRDVFYLNLPEPVARQHMQTRFADRFLTDEKEFGTFLESKIKKYLKRMAFTILEDEPRDILDLTYGKLQRQSCIQSNCRKEPSHTVSIYSLTFCPRDGWTTSLLGV